MNISSRGGVFQPCFDPLTQRSFPACAAGTTSSPSGDGLASVLGFSLEQPPSDIRARCSSFDSYADFGDADSLADARAFLRYTLKCTELFSGDGFAYSAGGERGAREYLMRRLPVSSLWGAHWVELTGGILLCDGLK